jgi:phosphatidylserine/phosphatidylglycerophosphate/cardiolipin synthase-like enzyme
VTAAWPWPADTPLEIARRLLQSYRAALHIAAPDACSSIDEQAEQYGQGWVVPRIETVNPDDLLTAVDAAELVGVKVQVIYQWAYRDHIARHETPDGPRYRVADLLAYQANRRRERARQQGERMQQLVDRMNYPNQKEN